MATRRNSRKLNRARTSVLGKPNGVIQPRVQEAGPERFGIVAVDCAKARSKWMLCDFYGRVLIPPTIVEHGRAQLQLATVQLREACEQHGLVDHLVAVEMTGTYHRPVQRAVGYGSGPHFCIGRHLAGMEGEVAIEALLAADADYALDLAHATRAHHEMVHGFTALPVRWS